MSDFLEWATPRAHACKRKAKRESLDLQTCIQHQKKLLKDFQESEHFYSNTRVQLLKNEWRQTRKSKNTCFMLWKHSSMLPTLFFQSVGTLINAVCHNKPEGPSLIKFHSLVRRYSSVCPSAHHDTCSHAASAVHFICMFSSLNRRPPIAPFAHQEPLCKMMPTIQPSVSNRG